MANNDKINEVYEEMLMNEVKDDDNPKYMFRTTNTSLLVSAVKGKIDLLEYAKKEMAARGFDKNGKWIGFDKSKKLFNL
jgi:hypothetical protein